MIISPDLDRWRTPSDPVVLPPDEAHLWRVSLLAADETVHACASTLSADERQRADAFRFEKLRRRFVIGRGVLRTLLGRYLHRTPAELHFVYGPHGKPSLAGSQQARPLFFNVSQSEDVALIAVTWAGEIGVDLEHVRILSEWPEIAERILVPDPHAAPPVTLEDFFREWTRHEARIKAAGVGLGAPLAGEPRWSVHSLPPEKDFSAAVALPVGVQKLVSWSWDGNWPAGAGT